MPFFRMVLIGGKCNEPEYTENEGFSSDEKLHEAFERLLNE